MLPGRQVVPAEKRRQVAALHIPSSPRQPCAALSVTPFLPLACLHCFRSAPVLGRSDVVMRGSPKNSDRLVVEPRKLSGLWPRPTTLRIRSGTARLACPSPTTNQHHFAIVTPPRTGETRCPTTSHVADDIIAELRALDLRRAFHLAGEVVCDTLAADGAIKTFENQVCRFSPAHVAEHHLAAQHD